MSNVPKLHTETISEHVTLLTIFLATSSVMEDAMLEAPRLDGLAAAADADAGGRTSVGAALEAGGGELDAKFRAEGAAREEELLLPVLDEEDDEDFFLSLSLSLPGLLDLSFLSCDSEHQQQRTRRVVSEGRQVIRIGRAGAVISSWQQEQENAVRLH